jgi:GT2 family glycosyltransferase
LPGRGRNKGIIESTGQIIAFTDADCAVDKSWLSNITSHLAAQDQTIVGVGGPSMTPDSDGRFAKCIGSLWQTSFGAAGARNPALYKGLRDVEHNPTCNSAYRRWVFDKVGLFHQYLPVTEDEEIDTRIRRKGYRLLYAEDVVVWHHRKNKLGSFANQMFSYGFWRANSGRKGLVPLKLMHFAPPFLVLYALMLPMLALLSPQLSIIPLAVYLVLGLASGAYGAWKSRYMTCVVVTPVLGFVEHVAYGLGFLSGLLTNRKIQG